MDSREKEFLAAMTRRAFLGRSAGGIGALALGTLLDPAVLRAETTAKTPRGRQWPGAVHSLPFAPRAKRVIYLYMAGGPSHLETFDFKPKLGEMSGKPMPESITKGQQVAQLQGSKLMCYAPQHPF